jgi:hypothetical protein
VQLDQVLTSLQSDSREDLKALLDGLTRADSKPRGEDATPAGAGRPRRVVQRRARRHPGAERSTAQVLEALLGTEPGRDVARLIRGTAPRPTSSTATRTSSRR